MKTIYGYDDSEKKLTKEQWDAATVEQRNGFLAEGYTLATETVNGREYQVKATEAQRLTKADLIKRGWDGYYYELTGKRGACYIAYRSARSGELHIVASAKPFRNCGYTLEATHYELSTRS